MHFCSQDASRHSPNFFTLLAVALTLTGLLGLLWAGIAPGSASAQTPVTSILNSNGDTALEVGYNGSLLMPGTLDSGSIPTSGSGTRMMWYPNDAAFRAGRVDGSQWNDSNIGTYSVAFGQNTEASDRHAIALGHEAKATENGAVSIGGFATASNVAATALGLGTRAAGFANTAIGVCNSDFAHFVVGTGSFVSGSCDSRSDALVLEQDGDLGIKGAFRADLAGGTLAGHFQGSRVGSGEFISSHITFVENNGGSGSDGLAIQAGQDTDPGTGANFITFFDGDGDAVGAIQGNGSGGIDTRSGGSDYAEELPVAEEAETPEAADLVGVQGGEVSLQAEGAARVMIASTSPALTGNATPSTKADDDRRVAVAFVGQVPAKVRGTAKVGDLIVASGKSDGTGRAVSPSEYRRATHGPIAGQAWSAKSNPKVGEVTVAVGLGRSGAVAERMEEQKAQIDSLETRVDRLERLQKRVAELESRSATSLLAGLPGSRLLLGLLLGGLIGAGLFWRRRG